MGYHIGVKIQ